MNSYKWILFLIIVLATASCQKEVADRNDLDNPTDSSGKIVRLASIYIPDSLVYFERNYRYEPNGQIKTITTIQRIIQTNGTVSTLQGTTRFFRDGNGRIERIGTDPDTSRVNVIFSYSSSITTKPQFVKVVKGIGNGSIVLDSMTCSYYTNGQLQKTSHFLRKDAGGLDSSIYETYNYDVRGNLASKKQYADSSGNRLFKMVIEYKFEYDDKTNPLFIDEIAYFLHDGVFGYTASPNNVIKQINDYIIFPVDDLKYSFTYDSYNRPISYKNVSDNNNITLYYYK